MLLIIWHNHSHDYRRQCWRNVMEIPNMVSWQRSVGQMPSAGGKSNVIPGSLLRKSRGAARTTLRDRGEVHTIKWRPRRICGGEGCPRHTEGSRGSLRPSPEKKNDVLVYCFVITTSIKMIALYNTFTHLTKRERRSPLSPLPWRRPCISYAAWPRVPLWAVT